MLLIFFLLVPFFVTLFNDAKMGKFKGEGGQRGRIDMLCYA